MAMLVPVLVAAAELGMLQFNSKLLAQAIHWWRIIPNSATDNQPNLSISQQVHSLAEVLLVWWDTLRSGETSWRVGLTGLDRMLSDFRDGQDLA
jgi:hypothetical protein